MKVNVRMYAHSSVAKTDNQFRPLRMSDFTSSAKLLLLTWTNLSQK